MIHPMDFLPDREVQLIDEYWQDVVTNRLPHGEQLIKVYLRRFDIKACWMAETGDCFWLVWAEFHHEETRPRLLGFARDWSQVDGILRDKLSPDMGLRAIYAIQQYAPRP